MERISTSERPAPAPAAEAPAVPDRPWSTMPGGWRAMSAPVRLDGELDERMHAAAFAWKEGITDEVPIWTPKGEIHITRRGLSWGYTLLETDGELRTLQMVVFIVDGSRRIGHDERGTCTIANASRVSAWGGPTAN